VDELVSVVIPSYNHAGFLAQAMRSVYAQTYRPLELVVVDDGSTDDSYQVIRTVAAEAPFAVSARRQPNGGVQKALHRACAAASGRILAVLNSDDVYEPRRLETLVPLVDAERGALAFSGVTFIDGHDRPLPAGSAWPAWYETGLAAAAVSPALGFALLQHNFSVSSSNFVFSRRLFERLGGFADFRFVQDWDFLFRTIYYVEPIFVPRPLLRYRVHAGGTTETVRTRLESEGRAAFARYCELLRGAQAPNPLAPGPETWPRVWSAFAKRRSFFSPSSIADLAEVAPARAPSDPLVPTAR
jgi:glycosyltransferase involved in cell wall biosynthesis